MAALQATILQEPEPLVTLTHLLRLCRDEHQVLWARVNEPVSRSRVTAVLAELADLIARTGPLSELHPQLRRALSGALSPDPAVPPVVIARALAEFVDAQFGHTFFASFRKRSPYQPGVGDPVPLDSPDWREVTSMRSTSPPWRLANRLDETRRVRLAGELTVQFRIVFDYSAADALDGIITAETVIATCHPNADFQDLDLSRVGARRTFPVGPVDPARQRRALDRLIGNAVAAGASIVVLPELCVTEQLALELEHWVRRPAGPRLLLAGSFHHADAHGPGDGRQQRRNTALAWLRGHAGPLTHDKHSPGDQPILEDIQPQGWPELRIYVTADGWHVVMAICRDLLNPHAVHALAEAGVNLALVPAMSETLMAFGGPTAQLVGARQALVAVANNPGDWSADGATALRRPARALFGHPGLSQQTRFVQSPDSSPGVALMRVHSAEISWLPDAAAAAPMRRKCHPQRPGWVHPLEAATLDRRALEYEPQPVALRHAAVLVLLTEGADGLQVLLTERASALADYPGQAVFPGGAAEPSDTGPVATALREAHEETGLIISACDVLGVLPSLALPTTGFLVHPVLAWSGAPAFTGTVNEAEVAAVIQAPLRQFGAGYHAVHIEGPEHRALDGLRPLGVMTGAVIAQVVGLLTRGGAVGRSGDAVRSAPSGMAPRSRIGAT